MPTRVQPRRLLLVLALTLLSAGCGRPPQPLTNVDITGAEFGRTLALIDHDGKPRHLHDFKGKAVVVTFGYTTCPDVCPAALTRFAEALRRLDGEAARVQVLFVSLDPERDAPRLKSYVTWFHPGMVGLYGDAAATAAAAREFRVFSARRPVEGGLGYVIDHSSGAYVLDPAGHLRLLVKDDATVESIVADLRVLLDGG